MRIRITFSKQGALRYTGHLDLHKLWERAARRVGLPLAYSQGFHPQPKMNIAAALPLGFSSRCEVMDLRLEQDIPLEGLASRLNDTMPKGIRVLHIEQVDAQTPALQTQVELAEYEVTAIESGPSSPLRIRSDLKRRIDSVMESESILRSRRGKEYDLRPLILDLKVMESGGLPSLQEQVPAIHMKLSAKEGATGRPEEVLDVLGIAFEETRIERTKLIFKLSPSKEEFASSSLHSAQREVSQ